MAGCLVTHMPHPPAVFGQVLRPRIGARDVDAAVAEVRAWFAERGREELLWFVGDSATPGRLPERLLEHGAEPDGLDPLLTGMVLSEEPPAVAGFDVRPVRSYEEFAALTEVAWEAVGMPEKDRVGLRAGRPERWRDYRANDDLVVFGAFLDGEPVASGTLVLSPLGGFLGGGATRPDMRGRGAYRALVRARWDAAVERGAPVLVVQAGAQSRPILRRLGFREVATVHVLLDRTAPR